ncbi:Rieske (2Fe-2S) protein [Haloferacaceae archaeon DSL9]
MDETRRIVAAADVPSETTLLVTLRAEGEEREAILTRLADGSIVAFENYCQHWTDVRLDKGEGALVRNDEIVCQKHAATFERDSGYCNFGPCEGAFLPTVDVAVEDGRVYLVDDDYAFSHVGPAEAELDSGGGRIDFTGT